MIAGAFQVLIEVVHLNHDFVLIDHRHARFIIRLRVAIDRAGILLIALDEILIVEVIKVAVRLTIFSPIL